MKAQALLTALLLIALSNVQARVERLDDSSSPRPQVQAPQVLADNGMPLAETSETSYATLKFGRIDYRLATAAFIGQQASVYYIIPADIRGLQSLAALQVEWQGDGRFADGRTQAGGRVKVWSGTVDQAWMQATLTLSVKVDLHHLRLPDPTAFGFEPYFEIETSS